MFPLSCIPALCHLNTIDRLGVFTYHNAKMHILCYQFVKYTAASEYRCVAERKNFKLLFLVGITLAFKVSILYFHLMRMI